VTGIEAGFRGGVSADWPRRYARIALALGLNPGASGGDIVEALAAAVGRPPIPPRIITAGASPCKDNILLGKQIDLLRFPTPLIHQDDGGATSRPTG
jgi:UbiD family decarboxylase